MTSFGPQTQIFRFQTKFETSIARARTPQPIPARVPARVGGSGVGGLDPSKNCFSLEWRAFFRFSAPLGSNMHQNCIFMKKYSPLEQEAHFCKSVRKHVQQKSNFSAWVCLRMPSCRIWAAKQISKIPWKNVYYLHMSPP